MPTNFGLGFEPMIFPRIIVIELLICSVSLKLTLVVCTDNVFRHRYSPPQHPDDFTPENDRSHFPVVGRLTIMPTMADDNAFQVLNSIVYSTQFDHDLDASVDRIFERVVLSAVHSGQHTVSWFEALFTWCIDNSGWRQELVPSHLDEAEVQAFLKQLSSRLNAYRRDSHDA